jgi:hypothetical protein
VLEIMGEVDRSHSAAAELALEAVTIGEGVSELVKRVWHVGRPWLGALTWGGVERLASCACRPLTAPQAVPLPCDA